MTQDLPFLTWRISLEVLSKRLKRADCASKFGIRDIVKDKKRANKHKCLPALILHNEAEGTRTLNLRIDSLRFAFVSTCE